MGMASSQARLLTLTARMHDVEYKAQNIMNQKIALATQKDDVYQEYMDALEAKKIQVAIRGDAGGKTYLDATFNTVCKYREDRIRQYALHDTRSGKLVVDDDVYTTFYNGYDNDKYSFAWAMLGMGEMGDWGGEDFNCTFVGLSNEDDDGIVTMTAVEQLVFDKNVESDNPNSTLIGAEEDLDKVLDDPDSTLSDIQKALEEFRDVLYKECSKEIYEYMCYDKNVDKDEALDEEIFCSGFDKEDFPEDKFNYYVHLFEEIQNSGGCISIYNLDGGNENDKVWFNNMINTGRLTISVYNKDGANRGWQETSVATSTNESMLMEVDDNSNEKKAEAKYEHELGIINKKDTKFDQDLKNLETEETSLKTEIESIKKVKDENIERTFGIFS